jgi:hypothetical protein
LVPKRPVKDGDGRLENLEVESRPGELLPESKTDINQDD